jgi:GTP-binding protein
LPPGSRFPNVCRMQIKSAEFITSATGLADCPAWDLPEFAFIGRSNVGKSSMINMLSNKHALAKVSATPGKTRLLNFFLMNEKWSLVDLPGYGFARTGKSEKINFNELVRVFVLIDSRHPPQRIDLDFTAWLGGTGAPFSLVFTKVDKQSVSKTKSNITLFQETLASHTAAVPEALVSSAKTRSGRNEILRAIGHAIGA